MKVQICNWKKCIEKFGEYITKRLKNDAKFYNKKNVLATECECLWKCEKWPNIVIDGQIHNKMNPAKASELIYHPKKKKKKNANT